MLEEILKFKECPATNSGDRDAKHLCNVLPMVDVFDQTVNATAV